MKKILLYVLVFIMLISVIAGCTETARPVETASVETPKPTAKKVEPTPEPTPEPTLDPIEHWREQAYGDGAIIERIDAVYELLDLNREAGIEAAYDVYNDIDFTSKELVGRDSDDIKNFMSDAIVFLTEAGYENIASDTVTKILNPDARFSARAVGKYPNLFETLMPLLIDSGIFEDNGASTEESRKRVAIEDIAECAYEYSKEFETLDEKLEAAYFVSKEITPRVNERYKEFMTDYCGSCWTLAERFWVRDFAEYMPRLSDKKTSAGNNSKYLVVSRSWTRGDQYPDPHANFIWRIEFGYQVLLPSEFVPRDLSEITHLITIDTTFEYEKKYYTKYGTKSIDVFSAYSRISVYDYKTGELVKTVGNVKTEPKEEIYFTGDLPEYYYVNPDRIELSSKIMEAVSP